MRTNSNILQQVALPSPRMRHTQRAMGSCQHVPTRPSTPSIHASPLRRCGAWLEKVHTAAGGSNLHTNLLYTIYTTSTHLCTPRLPSYTHHVYPPIHTTSTLLYTPRLPSYTHHVYPPLHTHHVYPPSRDLTSARGLQSSLSPARSVGVKDPNLQCGVGVQ